MNEEKLQNYNNLSSRIKEVESFLSVFKSKSNILIFAVLRFIPLLLNNNVESSAGKSLLYDDLIHQNRFSLSSY